MQASFFAKAVLIAAGAVLINGCRSQPIHEVVAAPVPVVGKTVSMDEVLKAMVRAGVRAGWEMLPEQPGRISGRYVRGQHRANVDITYNTKTYDIKYRDSSWGAEGTGQVHRVYNTWVQNLDRAIRSELVQLNH
jgi:hypothetical protein